MVITVLSHHSGPGFLKVVLREFYSGYSLTELFPNKYGHNPFNSRDAVGRLIIPKAFLHYIVYQNDKRGSQLVILWSFCQLLVSLISLECDAS